MNRDPFYEPKSTKWALWILAIMGSILLGYIAMAKFLWEG
jgi:hypothetical protein